MSLRSEYSKRVHFFDLDRTIIEQNTSVAFCRYLCDRGILPRVALIQSFLIGWRAKVMRHTLDEMHAVLFKRVLKGVRLSDLENAVDDFLRCFLWASIYPPVFSILRRQQHLGAVVVIMSSSPTFLVQKIADQFGVDLWMGTEYEVDVHGRLIGIKQFLDGSKKAQGLQGLSKEYGWRLEETKAYSDSYHDLPFLLTAGNAAAVNPDHRLRLLARQRRWEIL
ncbi:MAG: HAD-IB family hydrolase [Simkania sp.]|nr:HAD-IB family hydrolase [Simkania sp.]